jgi:predicted RNA-binding Zn-ribbon protein involved in translation (DUF1610 family)
MLPRSRQKPHDEEQLTSRVWISPGTEREGAGESGTARYAEFSKVSAKMVDLSLQEAQRDLTPRGTVKNELAPVSLPLRGPAADVSSIGQPPIENAQRPRPGAPETAVVLATAANEQQEDGTPHELRIPNVAVLYSGAKVILREIPKYWSGSATSRKPILGHLTLGAQRTAFLIRHWSRMLTAQAPALCALIQESFGLAKRYRCPDCGREVGARSHPRNLSERYVLPLLLMQPVRCVACFHRDYRLIFTPVGDRSRRHDPSVGKNNRNAA